MDVAYNQHSPYSRRHDRSHTNLGHLSLAPLTSRLPLDDAENLPDVSAPPRLSTRDHRFSYIEGRSAPTTPGILSRSSSRASLRRTRLEVLPKSKSIANLDAEHLQSMKARVHTPGGRSRRDFHDDWTLTAADRNDSDWLLRAGALIASETRESKGQSWLVSRASSTSLTGDREEEEEEEARRRDRIRERSSRRSSRRGSTAAASVDADDEISPVTTRRSFGSASRPTSRYGSRPSSRRGSRLNLLTPMEPVERERDGYFDIQEEDIMKPDFVDVNEEEEEYDEDQALEDELAVKKLAKKGTLGLGTWVERLMGWSLFDVEEDGEETEAETIEETSDNPESTRRSEPGDILHNPAKQNIDDSIPPPRAEEGGWQDAAWLLSVATKVLL